MKKILKFILWVMIFCLLFSGVKNGYKKVQKYIYPLTYREIINKYSYEYNLDSKTVFAIIKCESGFDETAVSSVGAKGLMQLTNETFEWVCSKYKDSENDVSYLFDAEKNIQAGCRLLRLLYDDFGDTKTVIAAYHAGRNITYKWLKNAEYSDDGKTLKKIPYADTSTYVSKVLKTIDKYEEIYEGEL